jgi:hypothetical protein
LCGFAHDFLILSLKSLRREGIDALVQSRVDLRHIVLQLPPQFLRLNCQFISGLFWRRVLDHLRRASPRCLEKSLPVVLS